MRWLFVYGELVGVVGWCYGVVIATMAYIVVGVPVLLLQQWLILFLVFSVAIATMAFIVVGVLVLLLQQWLLLLHWVFPLSSFLTM